MRETQHSEVRPGTSRRIGPGRRGQALIVMALSFLVVGGMLGLAIDVGIAYYIKARLSQAVDGAALSGARALSRVDLTLQTAKAQAVAQDFFHANFPNGFWGCTTSIGLPVVTQDDTSKIRFVTVTATATTPLYFLRMIGKSTTTVASSAVAQRRDANIVIILDRSGSMKSAVSQLVSAADWFVGQFAPGRDQVGLVTFGGTYNLIKPTTSFSPTVTNAINTLLPVTVGKTTTDHVNGTTNHSQPLWVAYQALAEVNQPTALNVIVFFTDGQPNTVTADWQPYLAHRTATGTQGKSGYQAACNNGQTAGVYNPVIGYALTYSGGGSIGGLFATPSPLPPYQPQTTVKGTAATDYVSAAYDLSDSSNSTSSTTVSEVLSMANSAGCAFTSNVQSVASDFTQIPTSDYYGNLTNPGTKYKAVTLTSFNGTNLTAAAYNAGDYAAQRMRLGILGSPTPIVPLLDTISLSTTGGAIDAVYMKRLANTLDSQIYDHTKPVGLYVSATTNADLQGAFVQIASQILHLSM
ncbi:MAG: VWA domain-containing protein [Bryobacteraceae bacterium]|nr:VWA domain-containing protein [Bryobacteraceae bacterium]